MARYSDVPTRAVSRAFGSAMQYTEFTPANALLQPRNPMWRRLDVHPDGESPMVFQIFGSDPVELLRAAEKILPWGADIIDINLGCSSPQVNQRGAGAALMRDPARVAAIFKLLSRELPLPVTGKIRLGWDEGERNFLEIGKIMVDNGAALIAMHPRTKMQKYRGAAEWGAIGALKRAVDVPVIGSGDVRSVADIAALQGQTGCDGVMIGRGAIGNPWIFARVDRLDCTPADILTVLRRHLAEMVAYYGEAKGLERLHPHLRRYFKGLAVKRFVLPMLGAKSVAELEGWLGVFATAVPQDQPLRELQGRTWFPMPLGVPIPL
jgi:tRNA-dihydrouridine synthase B